MILKIPKFILLVWSFVFFMPFWVIPGTSNLKQYKNSFFLYYVEALLERGTGVNLAESCHYRS